jgi:hypothetical protein
VSSAARLIARFPHCLCNRSGTPAEAGGRRFLVFDNYVIEIRPDGSGTTMQVGIVVRDGRKFRFFAADHAFNPLEGRLFKNPKEAEKEARRRLAEVTTYKPIGWLLGARETRRRAAL